MPHILPHLPSPPKPPGTQIAIHPSDLFVGAGGFYTQLQFIDYLDFSNNIYDYNPNPINGIVLPIPAKLNDVQTVIWTAEGLSAAIISAAAQYSAAGQGFGYWERLTQLGLLGALAKGIATGIGFQINPMLWMMFRNPDFKKFTFEWHFTPVDEKESEDLVKIINYIKKESLPSAHIANLANLVWKYPSIALIKFYPDNKFTFKMKPCAVLQVDVDYTAANMPSFFKNGAPTVIRLRILVNEIDIWTKNNYDK